MTSRRPATSHRDGCGAPGSRRASSSLGEQATHPPPRMHRRWRARRGTCNNDVVCLARTTSNPSDRARRGIYITATASEQPSDCKGSINEQPACGERERSRPPRKRHPVAARHHDSARAHAAARRGAAVSLFRCAARPTLFSDARRGRLSFPMRGAAVSLFRCAARSSLSFDARRGRLSLSMCSGMGGGRGVVREPA